MRVHSRLTAIGARRGSVAVFVFALLMLEGCEGTSGPTEPTPSAPVVPPSVPVVRGTVVDFQTQTPISGGIVRVSTGPLSTVAAEAVTDANGRYSFAQPQHTGMSYSFSVNNSPAGRGYPAGPNYRGDLLVDAGTCISRYGVVLDARTLRPIAGASVGSAGAVTSIDGWYRIDWGCPSSGSVGFNTTFLRATHPNYISPELGQILGRGIQKVQRLDFLLEPR